MRKIVKAEKRAKKGQCSGHADAHDDYDCLTKLAKCQRDDGLVVWDDTLHVSEVEDFTRRGSRSARNLHLQRSLRKPTMVLKYSDEISIGFAREA